MTSSFHLTDPFPVPHTRWMEAGRRAAQDVMRILVAVLAVYSVPSISRAQTQFSTFSGAAPSFIGIGPAVDQVDLWGVSFVTDNHTYLLNSITLGVSSGSAAPVTFTGGLYPGYGDAQASLEPLNAYTILTPNTPSHLTFTSGYQILLPNTRYTAIFNSDLPASVLFYGSWNATGPWSLAWPETTYGTSVWSWDGGANWTFFFSPLAFSVDARFVPEPRSAALILVGLIGFYIRKRHSVGGAPEAVDDGRGNVVR